MTKQKNKKGGRFKFGLLLPGALIVFALALALDILTYSSKSDDSPSDVAIVLGAAVWDKKPSPVFKERINHAVNLYKEGRVKFIIFTGGVGDGDQQAESIVAAKYALEIGGRVNDMFCETSSRITFENLIGAKEIMEKQNLNRVLIVSDPLHMRRSLMIARDLGMDAYPSPTPTTRYVGFQSKSGFLLREIYFYGRYLVERAFVNSDEYRQQMTIQPCQ